MPPTTRPHRDSSSASALSDGSDTKQAGHALAVELSSAPGGDPRLAADVRLLSELLSNVLHKQVSPQAFDATIEVLRHSKRRRASGSVDESFLENFVHGLDAPDARTILRALCIQFDLANLAEDRHRIRVLLERESQRWPAPRTESIGAALNQLKEAGFTADQVQQLLDGLEVEMVFTAHPTEAKRRSIRSKLRRLREYLAQLDRATPRQRDHLRRQMDAELTSWWQTEFIRPRRPTVLEEVQRGLSFTTTLWQVVPEIYQDLRQALAASFPPSSQGSEFRLPNLLRFGSWMGGDRDGNPFVISDVTAEALLQLRRNALKKHIDSCVRLLKSMSESDQKTVPSTQP